MSIAQMFWELNKTVRFSPLEVAMFFYLYKVLETEVEVSEIDSNLMSYLSLTERQVRYVRESLAKKGVIIYFSGNGRGNATIYQLGTLFSATEKGVNINNISKGFQSSSFVTFEGASKVSDNQSFSNLEKGDNKGDNVPLSIDYHNLNQYQKENNLSKDRLQKKKSVCHSPCPDTTARKIKEEIKSEPTFSQRGFADKKKTRFFKVFLTEGEILSIKDFIDRFNRELGQYYGTVMFEKTNSFSRQNILKLISMYDRHTIQMIFEMIKSSDFLLNKSKPYAWSCTFDWIVVPDNFGKIFAGMYANFNEGTSVNVSSTTSPKQKTSSSQSQQPYDEFNINTWSKAKRDEYLTEVYACWGMTYDPDEYERELIGNKTTTPSPQKPKEIQCETKPDYSKISDPTVLRVLSEVGVIKK